MIDYQDYEDPFYALPTTKEGRSPLAVVTKLEDERVTDVLLAWELAELEDAAHVWDAAHTEQKVWSKYTSLAWIATGVRPLAPPPDFLTRTDGAKGFYVGKINCIFGDPECGKTWVALAAIVEALNAGKRCAMIDVDHNGDAMIVSHLIRLGADPNRLMSKNFFRYCEPEDRVDLTTIVDHLTEWAPDGIVLVDSLGEIFPMLGLSSEKNDEVTAGIRRALTPLAKAGAAVVVIDHMAKSSESNQSFAIGAMAKKRAIRGLMLHAKALVKFAPGAIGSVLLTISKDSSGRVRENAGPGDVFGKFVLDSTDDTVSVFRLEPPLPVSLASDGGKRPTNLMGKVSEFLRLQSSPVSKATVETGVVGKRDGIRRALDVLCMEGYVSTVNDGRYDRFKFVKSFNDVDVVVSKEDVF